MLVSNVEATMRKILFASLSLVLSALCLGGAPATAKDPFIPANPKIAALLRPDLTILAMQPGGTAVFVHVRNNGPGPSKVVLLNLKVYRPGAEAGMWKLAASKFAFVPALAAGKSTWIKINTAPVPLKGALLYGHVDSTNVQVETNEGNNAMKKFL
jgi:hypothetical protein